MQKKNSGTGVVRGKNRFNKKSTKSMIFFVSKTGPVV